MFFFCLFCFLYFLCWFDKKLSLKKCMKIYYSQINKYTLKMLGYFNPNLDQILILNDILTQSLGLSIFYPKLGFRVYKLIVVAIYSFAPVVTGGTPKIGEEFTSLTSSLNQAPSCTLYFCRIFQFCGHISFKRTKII